MPGAGPVEGRRQGGAQGQAPQGLWLVRRPRGREGRVLVKFKCRRPAVSSEISKEPSLTGSLQFQAKESAFGLKAPGKHRNSLSPDVLG